VKSPFIATPPVQWSGRYSRIPGETTAFHVRLGPSGEWWPYVDWTLDDDTAECPMVDVTGVRQLALAVHAGKQLFRGKAGGSFLINEFGQVLCPSPFGDGHVALVGRWTGPVLCQDRHHPGRTFDLTDDRGLGAGSAWDRPYLGLPHNLSARGEIYFWKEEFEGSGKVTPRVQDKALINALRGIRPAGAVRFVVACGGLVLTKVPIWESGYQRWEPRYVGRLDYGRWFEQES
jgi:hypothetical protein